MVSRMVVEVWRPCRFRGSENGNGAGGGCPARKGKCLDLAL